MMIKKYLVMVTFLLAGTVVKAQAPADDANYTQVITQRSAKILTAIGITDSAQFKKVRNVLVDQYRFINDAHNKRNADVKAINDAAGDDKAGANTKIAAIDSSVAQQLNKQHTIFLSKLGKDLSAEQVEKVKDEMTYKKVAVTYNAYLDELPQLTEPQKAQLKAWLVEAREKAIDAGSADEKTAIFGKYKGRINNYLSKEGYDMKQAGIDWQKRIADRKAAKAQ
jgi:nucleotide-binding universal stress UspA family protein